MKLRELIREGDVVNINQKPITIKDSKYLGDSRWRLWFNDKKGYYVLHISLYQQEYFPYQKDKPGTGWIPANWDINGKSACDVLAKRKTPQWYDLCKHIDDYMNNHHAEEMQQEAEEQLNRPSDPSEWGDPIPIIADEPDPDDPKPTPPKKPNLRIVK